MFYPCLLVAVVCQKKEPVLSSSRMRPYKLVTYRSRSSDAKYTRIFRVSECDLSIYALGPSELSSTGRYKYTAMSKWTYLSGYEATFTCT